MARLFGDRDTFAVEFGPIQPPALRVVDLWMVGQRLTVDDNVAFVPFLCRAMRSTAAQVRRRGLAACPLPGRSPEEIFRLLQADETAFRESFWFMQWGEILDNVSRYAYLDDDLVIVFAFWRLLDARGQGRGEVFVATLQPDEFATTVEDAAVLMDTRSAR